MKPAHSKRRRVIKLIIGSFFLLFIGFCLGAFTILYEEYGVNNPNAWVKPRENTSSSSYNSNTTQKNTSKQNPVLLGYLNELNATYVKDLDVNFIESYKDNDRHGEYIQSFDGYSVYGGTAKDNKNASITVLSGRSIDDTKRIVAHEYLHHIWYTQLSKSEKDMLSSKLIVQYSEDQSLKDRANYYINRDQLNPTEMLSMYCTESSDSYLTPDILATCNKYINRSALVMLR